MLKPEYSNFFSVSVNAQAHEVGIRFLVRGVCEAVDGTSGEQIQQIENLDVAYVVMTLENATGLRDVLTKAIENSSIVADEKPI
ncbi:hypothetical protein FACS1894187_15020 [Synergistales bacterium]|nr:hypothetical protein FACS1894187_15020 [Synergistales bacterium]